MMYYKTTTQSPDADDSKVVTKTAVLNGNEIAYSNKTHFAVQVGKDKGAYTTKYSFIGDLHNAVFYYKGINIGNGYKKRLLMNDKLLARSFN